MHERARFFIRLLFPMPVVANMPMWCGNAFPEMPTGKSSTRSPDRSFPTWMSPRLLLRNS